MESRRILALRSAATAWRRVIEETYEGWSDHHAMTQAAAIAFYTLASFAPILIVVIAVAGTVFGADAVRGEIVRQLQGLMGHAEAQLVQDILKRAAFSRSGGVAGLLAICTVLFAASGAFLNLQDSLNDVWEVVPKPGSVIRTLLKKRLACFALILGIGFLMLASLALSAALTGFEQLLLMRIPIAFRLIEVLHAVISFGVLTLFFAMVYRILPDAEISWQDVWLGAVFTSTLFSIGKWLIALYLGRAAVASPYGAAGSVVVLLFWVYFSSLILLFGAELTRVTSRRINRSLVEPSPGAMRAPHDEALGHHA